jgi:arsenical pump membrane protein
VVYVIAFIIFLITSLLIILSFFFYPKIKISKYEFSSYWIIAIIGAILSLIFKQITFNQVFSSLVNESSMNPTKLIVIFICMAVLSLYLDEIGFFKYLANIVIKKFNRSKWQLFFGLYSIVAILTVFTSNDVIILTLTFFIIYFSKNAKIDPIPFLFAEFIAANTLSILLIIGNPTNMYLSSINNISFISYFKVMILPTIATLISSLTVLSIMFRKELNTKIEHIETSELKVERYSLILGLVTLFGALIFLTISNYLKIEMWVITLFFLIVLSILSNLNINSRIGFNQSIKRAPWNFIPFLISMFIIIISLENNGITSIFSKMLGTKNPIFVYGFSSALMGNLMNNIPMSIFYGSVISNTSILIQKQAIYASIIGSNLSALFTPLGSLAGLMWLETLKKEEINLKFKEFIIRGSIVALVTLFFALVTLKIVL